MKISDAGMKKDKKKDKKMKSCDYDMDDAGGRKMKGGKKTAKKMKYGRV